MSKKIFTDESLRTFVDEVKSYTDTSISNHNHDSKYDAKGSANSALESAQSYTDTLMAGFEEGFEEVIGQMYGEDLTDINAPTIREIANDESSKVQINLDSHVSNTDLHFTTSEKTKLSKIETGAQKNTVTGIKGDSESSYRIGNVNITKANIDLGNVDNTSDINKPVSTAQQEAMDSLFVQAKKYADDKDALLLNNSSTAVDSIMELATAMAENEDVVDALEQAIGTKANASDLTSHTSNKSNPHGITKEQLSLGDVENKSSATIRSEITKSNVTNALGYTPYTQTEVDSLLDGKVDKFSGKGLSTNDYTTAEKTKLSGIAEGAQENVIESIKVNGAVQIITSKSVDITVPTKAEDIGAAESIHGTHVTWSTTSPKMNGTATVGTETKVARGDHVHPTDTSRASQIAFDEHLADTTKHITSTERTNWNAAKTHADLKHAPTDAEKNQNAFSNISVSGQTTVAADTTTDTVTFVGSNVTITTDATNDKVTFSVADGDTSTAGIVKLTNSTSSTSTTTAATPSSVKSAYDLANTAKTNAATAQTKADNAYSLAESKVGSLSDLGITATAKELNYVDGVTSSIQTQLDNKAASDHNHLYYGVCSTAADTVAKTVTVENFSSLVTGAMVIVKFTEANSASSPTLNVNSTGAKPICRYGTTAASTNTSTTGWRAGAVQIFVYDGTSWIRDFWENTTYSNAGLGCGYATCSTAESTVAKTATLSSYSLTTGGIVSVKFTNAVPASATLNINSKGAKNIYFRGSAITANVIKAGDIATFVYSSQYHLISIDRWQNDIDSKQATITGAATTITGSNLTASRALISNSSGKVAVSDVTSTELGYLDGVTSGIQAQIDAKSDSDHEHNYAGSNEPSGAANSANKLNTNAGNATQPVYFSGGIPVACTNTLGKSVPSDAVFTDGKVSQVPTSAGTTNANYRLLLSGSADDNSHTEGARKDPDLYFNPSTGMLTVPIVKLGDATISYDTTEKAIVFNFL